MQIELLWSVISRIVIGLRLLLRRLLLDRVLARLTNVHGLHPIKADSSPSSLLFKGGSSSSFSCFLPQTGRRSANERGTGMLFGRHLIRRVLHTRRRKDDDRTLLIRRDQLATCQKSFKSSSGKTAGKESTSRRDSRLSRLMKKRLNYVFHEK